MRQDGIGQAVRAHAVFGSMRHYLGLSETFTLMLPVIVSIRDSNVAVVISSLLLYSALHVRILMLCQGHAVQIHNGSLIIAA